MSGGSRPLTYMEENAMKPRLLVPLLLVFSLFGCKETIVEYRVPKEYTNDLLHGDIVGKVVQRSSGAMVTVSQENPIDSMLINSVDGSFAFRELRAGNYDLKIRADNYRIYTRTNLLLPGGSVAYAGEIDLSTTPDLVDRTYPENNSEIVYDWRYGRIAISILFTHPMDRISVENAFSTNPPSEGVFIWGNFTQAPMLTLYADAKTGSFQEGATITTFSKVSSFTYSMSQKDSYVDTVYTVSLATSAHDTLGNALRFPLQFSFRTVQSNVSIYGIQTSPVHGDVNVAPLNSNGINITFPRRMDPASTEAATIVRPPMTTVFLWPEANVLRIYPGGPFLSDTTITVHIDGTARDRDGIPLGQDFSFWFRTAPFQVTYSTPVNGQLFVSQSQVIGVTFDSYVTLSSAQQGFSISPPIYGSVAYSGTYPYENPSQIIFTPSGTYQPNTKYTVTISSGVKDMYGVSMRAPYTFSFVTRPN